MGLLDFLNSDLFAQKEQPANAFQPGYSNALIGFGTGLLGSGGYSTMPISGGQAFAQGLQGLQQGMAQDRAQALQGLQGKMLGQQVTRGERAVSNEDATIKALQDGTGPFANMSPAQRQALLIAGPQAAASQGVATAFPQPTKVGKGDVLLGPAGPDGKPTVLFSNDKTEPTHIEKLLTAYQTETDPTRKSILWGQIQKESVAGNVDFAAPGGPAPFTPALIAEGQGAFYKGMGSAPWGVTAIQPGGMMAQNSTVTGGGMPQMPGHGKASPYGGMPNLGAAAPSTAMPQAPGMPKGVFVDQRPQIGPKIEEKMLDMADAQSRLGTITSAFKPEFLQIENRFGQTWAAIKDKMGMNLSPEQRASLAEFSQFRANSLDNVNRLVNILTGAAMGVDEAKRIMATAPNAGTGIFDGDSPTEFKSKLDNTTQQINSALMRYNYAKNQGIDPLKIPLAEVPKMVNEYGNSVAADLRKQAPDIAPDILRAQVNLAIRNRFGMVR